MEEQNQILHTEDNKAGKDKKEKAPKDDKKEKVPKEKVPKEKVPKEAKVGKEEDKEKVPEQLITGNKGTGAGGANTNYYGKKFEEKTNNEQRLLEQGYTKKKLTNSKKSYDYLSKTFEDRTVVFVKQYGFKKYMMEQYDIDKTKLYRHPDEAYIIEYSSGRKVLKILEKKEQRVNGSVEDKLMHGHAFKRDYVLNVGGMFEVHYGFCVSSFLQKKIISSEIKYTNLRTILEESNIACLFGDDDNYFETFDLWFNSSL
jgi:hypothetical protein